MSVESATYLNDLNVSFPAAGDQKQEGDDHLRLIKAVLKNTFPNVGGRAWRHVSKAGAGPHTLAATDHMTIVPCSHTATAVINLPNPATVGNGWCAILVNYGTAAYTVTPAAGTINAQATYSLAAQDAVLVSADGTNYVAIPLFYLRKNAELLAGLAPASASTADTIASRNSEGESYFQRLYLNGDAARQDLLIYDRDLGGDYWQLYMNAGNLYFVNSVAGQDRVIFDAAGNIYLDGDVTGFYSDERLKKDVQNLKYRAQDAWHIRPVRFKWNDHRLAKEEGKEALGFIAQEVQQWCPEAVEEREDPRTPGETYLWVNYEMLIPVAFQIIKDLENQVRGFERFKLPRVEKLAALEERVMQLEAKLAALEVK